jgi:hypothetical protein
LPAHPSPQRIAVTRAVLVLVWAAAIGIAIGDHVPTTDTDVPVVAAALLTAYPLIDVVASRASAPLQEHGTALRLNAAISALAAAFVGATAFGSDAGAALAAFAAWAAVFGAIQFVLALRGAARCRCSSWPSVPSCTSSRRAVAARPRCWRVDQPRTTLACGAGCSVVPMPRTGR